jgi:hypothetical protein
MLVMPSLSTELGGLMSYGARIADAIARAEGPAAATRIQNDMGACSQIKGLASGSIKKGLKVY